MQNREQKFRHARVLIIPFCKIYSGENRMIDHKMNELRNGSKGGLSPKVFDPTSNDPAM